MAKAQRLHVWLSEEEKLCFGIAACLGYQPVSQWARDHLIWEAKKKIMDSEHDEDVRMRLRQFFTKEQLVKAAQFLEKRFK